MKEIIRIFLSLLPVIWLIPSKKSMRYLRWPVSPLYPQHLRLSPTLRSIQASGKRDSIFFRHLRVSQASAKTCQQRSKRRAPRLLPRLQGKLNAWCWRDLGAQKWSGVRRSPSPRQRRGRFWSELRPGKWCSKELLICLWDLMHGVLTYCLMFWQLYEIFFTLDVCFWMHDSEV